VEYLYYTSEEIKERILTLLQEAEEKMCQSHPNSFYARTYPSRRARYLELLGQLQKGERISSFVMAKLFHPGARHDN